MELSPGLFEEYSGISPCLLRGIKFAFLATTLMLKVHGNVRIGVITVAVLIWCASTSAQIGKRGITNEADKTSHGSIRGRIVLPGGAFVNESIKITLLTLRETISVIYADTQGQFEFPGLAPGNYKLEIEGDRQRFEVSTEPVQVFKGTPSVVTLALKEKVSRSEERRVGKECRSRW